MKPPKMLAAVGLVLLLAGCGGGGGSKPATLPSPLASYVQAVAAAPTCASIFTAGATLPRTLPNGCRTATGDDYVPGTWECKDGRTLLGDSRGWGFLGTPVHLGEAASDPGYKAAYTACTG